MRKIEALPLVLLGLAVAGCATGNFHQVTFAGEVSPELTDAKGRTVHVVRNVQMKDTVLEARIRARLEDFLLEHGYVIASPETSELYVLATFGSGNRLVGSIAPVFRPAEVKVERSRSGTALRRTYTPDRMEYLRVPTFQNSLWLQVLSSDAKYYRDTGMIRNLWRGEAAMVGKAEKISQAAAYLMVPALKFFGRGTTALVTMDVREHEIAWHNVP